MNHTYFITSRQGVINNISLFKYEFTLELMKQEEQLKNFCSWLKRNQNIVLHSINASGFVTLLPLEEETWQYRFFSIDKLVPPYKNTSLISLYINKLCIKHYKKLYNQFLNGNVFIIEEIDLNPFTLLKCFQLNIEVFVDGEFFIHLLPTTKIIGNDNVTHKYIAKLQFENKNNSNTDKMEFNLVDRKSFKRTKFNLLDKKLASSLWPFLDEHEKLSITFDYHFVANFSPAIFTKLSTITTKELNSSINFLIPISKNLNLQESIELHKKPFYQIDIEDLGNQNNLLIGGNKKVKEQKAAFYNGIYKSVIDAVIQPVLIDNYKSTNFSELLGKFNLNGSVKILPNINFLSTDNIDVELFKNIQTQNNHQLLIVVFTQYQQPKDYLENLFKLGIKIQIFQGEVDIYKLSNFTIKCLEKLGGTLSVIGNTKESIDTYFLGIDLGHSTHNDEHFSNMCIVLFNNQGELIDYKVIQKIPINEAINITAFSEAMNSIFNTIKKKKLPIPNKIIVHRDGKIHKQDLATFEKVFIHDFKLRTYDILEIIKSGYPIISAFDGKKYFNLKSGNSWQLKDKKYAILITNVQGDEQGVVLSPIIIKHKFGSTEFSKLVDQVYWFTKIYTNNLYNSTRLPATTEKANNLVGTGNKRHISTYLA